MNIKRVVISFVVTFCALLCCAIVCALVSPAPSKSGAQGGQAASSFASDAAEKIASAAEEKSPAAEIVCWGDSLTFGWGADGEVDEDDPPTVPSDRSYPKVLERLTGIRTLNYGVPGATSEEIAVMQGGEAPGQALDEYGTIDQRLMLFSRLHKGNVLVLEMGSNGGWGEDYDVLIEQYRSMIEFAGTDKYIIVGDTDDPGTSLADPEQQEFYDGAVEWDEDERIHRETDWEAALREAFGEHFLNMRVYLIEHGLEAADLEPDYDDEWMAEEGRVSYQLRTDETHLNADGYYAMAVGIYEKGRELGYW